MSVAPGHPGAALLQAVQTWRAANQAMKDGGNYPDDRQDAFDALCGLEDQAFAVVNETPATTLAGFRAKAEVLEVMTRRHHQFSIEEGCAAEEIYMLLSLCVDLAGRAA